MFSFLSNLSSTIYLSIIGSLLILVLLCSAITWHLKGSLDDANAALSQATSANSTLKTSLEQKELSCNVDSSIAASLAKENNAQVIAKDSALTEIDKIAIKPRVVSHNLSATTKVVNNEVDIDGSLPDSLVRVLSDTYNRVQERVDSNAR